MQEDLAGDYSIPKWLGAIMQHTIIWANVDLDQCPHMASLGHKELNGEERNISILQFQFTYICFFKTIQYV